MMHPAIQDALDTDAMDRTPEQEQLASLADALRYIEHSMTMALVPMNDRLREIQLSQRIAREALGRD